MLLFVIQNKLREISSRITEIPPSIIFTKGVDITVKNVHGEVRGKPL